MKAKALAVTLTVLGLALLGGSAYAGGHVQGGRSVVVCGGQVEGGRSAEMGGRVSGGRHSKFSKVARSEDESAMNGFGTRGG